MKLEKTSSRNTESKIKEKSIRLNNKEIKISWTNYLQLPPQKRYKRQHLLGRQLLKNALKKNYNIRFNEQMLVFNEYGKPYLNDFPNIHFNISHSNSAVILAISNEKLGIDIEDIYKFSPSLIEFIFTKEERELKRFHDNSNEYFTRLWTLKESYMKYIGTGLKFPLTDKSFLLETKSYPIKIERDNECFFQEKIGKNSIFSLCTEK